MRSFCHMWVFFFLLYFNTSCNLFPAEDPTVNHPTKETSVIPSAAWQVQNMTTCAAQERATQHYRRAGVHLDVIIMLLLFRDDMDTYHNKLPIYSLLLAPDSWRLEAFSCLCESSWRWRTIDWYKHNRVTMEMEHCHSSQ